MPAVNRHGYAAGQHVTMRLDALGQNVHSGCFGLSWWFIRVFVILGGAWGLTATHTIAFAYIIRALQQDIPMDTNQKALVNGSVMLGAFCGSFIFGNLADSRGRKFALIISFFLAHFASGLRATAPNLEILIVFRFISGLGLGGEQPVMAALIMELAPTRLRGRVLVYLDTFYPIGHAVAVILGREVEPEIGWRAATAFNGIAVLYIFLIYFWVPESPKWLAHAGHFEESVRVLRSIERQCSVYQPKEADEAIYNLERMEVAGSTGMYLVQPQKLSFWQLVANRFRILLRYPYLQRTLVLWVVWLGIALTNGAIDLYLEDHFVKELKGRGSESVVVYGDILAQIPGTLLASVLIDRIGRKQTLVGFLLLANAGALLEAYLDPTTTALLLSGCIRNFAFMGAWGTLYAYTPEHYPISIRVIGISYAWGISRIGAFAGPYAVIYMAEHWSMSIPAVMWTFCGISLAVVAVLVFFGVETTHEDSDKGDFKASSAPTDTQSVNESVVVYMRHEEEKLPVHPPIHFI
uniref:Major facilitator superfamily (MFS) profile domain-containing protein n=1 Tax=Globisporangium ultimum (strain ATCC 200006 / CBS 805.95 / DAOM BR144) TaxID=431595 RepID=K3WX90_GLOUD